MENMPVNWDEYSKPPDLLKAREIFEKADTVTLGLNNHSLGDTVIATGYLAAFLQASKQLNPGAHIDALVSPSQRALVAASPFENVSYRFVEPASKSASATQLAVETPQDALNPVFIQLVENDTEPPVTIKTIPIADSSITVIDKLYRYFQRNYRYTNHGPARYAHAVEELLQLSPGSIDVAKAQPYLALPTNEGEIYQGIARRNYIDTKKPQLGIIVEASSEDKRYPLDNWEKVVAQFSTIHPEFGINIILNAQNAEAKEKFGAKKILGLNIGKKGAETHLVSGSLQEMMVFLSHMNLVLSNDTGLAHVAAAVENGPQVVDLFKAASFPPSIWQSTPRQHPVVGTDGTMNSITPESVVKEAISCL